MMNSPEEEKQEQQLDDEHGLRTPADHPIDFLYQVGGQFYYAAHCCDPNDAHTGIIISNEEIVGTLGCGVNSGGDEMGPPRLSPHSVVILNDEPDQLILRKKDSPRRGSRGFNRGTLRRFPLPSNRLGTEPPRDPDGRRIVRYQFAAADEADQETKNIVKKLGTNRFFARQISYLGRARPTGGQPIPVQISYFFASNHQSYGNSQKLSVTAATENTDYQVAWLNVKDEDDNEFRVIVSAPDLLIEKTS
jgi:hypothetical protein